MRNLRFTFLCDNIERQMLRQLAKHLDRSQSDTVRLIIRQAAENSGLPGTPREGQKYERI